MSRGASISNGNSTYNGPGVPVWLKDPQMRELWDSKVTIWSVMA